MELSLTLIIVIITCAVSIGGFSNQRIIDDLIFYPPAILHRNQYYRFITHGFIHADVAHLTFNMLALYSFGEILEKDVFTYPCYFGGNGKIFFLVLYFGGLIAASIPDFIKYRDSYHFRSLGASGAISSVIFSSIVLLPKSGVGFAFLPINIPGYLFAILYLGVSAYLNKKGGGRVNHGAHLWGAVFGILFTVIMVTAFTHVNVWDNFLQQLKAPKPFLPYCNQ